jgi:hypothetical protein
MHYIVGIHSVTYTELEESVHTRIACSLKRIIALLCNEVQPILTAAIAAVCSLCRY